LSIIEPPLSQGSLKSFVNFGVILGIAPKSTSSGCSKKMKGDGFFVNKLRFEPGVITGGEPYIKSAS
jgi:hypothetical protein